MMDGVARWGVNRKYAFVFAWLAIACGAVDVGSPLRAAKLAVGLKAVDVTPRLDADEPVYLAGLEHNRAATEIHDRLYARAAVLRDDERTFALVSVDSIGVQRHTIAKVRGKLAEFDYVLVASTHTHSAPDCIGLWGPSESASGITPSYLAQLEDGVVEAVRGAAAAAVPARAAYGTAADESLLGDYRLPRVLDPVARIVRFDRLDNGKTCGLILQWNAHGVEPRNNMRVTRDVMGATVDELEHRHDCPVVYFSGAIGGLLGTPDDPKLLGDKHGPIHDAFDYMRAYGDAVADLADEALADAQPIELTPLLVSAKPVALPLDNAGFRMARRAGVLERPVYEWSGQSDAVGDAVPREQIDGALALETEVAYLRLGQLHVAAIPGELYPELVYGDYQDPADPGADFAEAPLEVPVMRSLPGDQTMLIGLANDEIGYIVPKRQWDVEAPYCYGRDRAQYGEANSVGPETARILADALAERVRDVSP